MTSTQLNLISPLETPLPPSSDCEVLTKSQWRTLLAIAETVIPSIEVSSEPSLQSLTLSAAEYTSTIEAVIQRLPEGVSRDLSTSYLKESASSIPAFDLLLKRIVRDYVREEARKGIRVILSALEYAQLIMYCKCRQLRFTSTRAGCLLTTGYSTPFNLQPIAIRQQILRNWSSSYLPPLKAAGRALEGLSRLRGYGRVLR